MTRRLHLILSRGIVCLALVAIVLVPTSAQTSIYDIVIRNGRVLDGAGNPSIAADVAIKDGRFVRIGSIPEKGKREIDARGQYVSPGWIDIMDQSGSVLPRNGLAENKLMMGVTTAIVEQADVVGGTCVNVGCIPSKNLIEAAHHYHAARSGFPGIAPCEPQLAWDAVLKQKRELVQSLRQQKYLDVLEAYAGITLLRGRAELTAGASSGAVAVRVGDRTVRARKVVVATGTRPAMPPIPGLADVGALDSTAAMELERLPASMLVVGAVESGEARVIMGAGEPASPLPTFDRDELARFYGGIETTRDRRPRKD